MTEALLSGKNLTRHFGGLIAVNDVTIELQRGLIHVVIGPNGAGKSTLINLLSGDLALSAGRVYFHSADITSLNNARRARLGIGRSYQKTNLFLPFTVFENCRLAVQAHAQHAYKIYRRAQSFSATNQAALAALAKVGLIERQHSIAAVLSHGEQRQLEVAMLLATNPQVLLLDEPLAGMGAEEAQQMIALIKRLASDHAILLVEHDMDAVFAAADVLTVMVNGEVLASGTPQAIRANREVQSAYLGVDE